MKKEITIVGAGLAGSEAALQLAEKGWKVKLYEMRPGKMTPAHQTDKCAELVCSNSLKSTRTDTAAGLLKAEMKLLGCKLLDIAFETSVPAGHALAVDRDGFAEKVTALLETNPNIELIREEVTTIPEGIVILAGGPLTSDALMQELIHELGEQHLYFFDAIAPIVSADSLDRSIIFDKSRYDKGEADYLNCPFNKEEYLAFVTALQQGEKHTAHEFENEFFHELNFRFYENCMPIEELARRGVDTLRFGVLRPVGLDDPRTGRRPYAVLQLRAENTDRTAFNLVGCQTMLKYGVQKEIFRLIPGMEKVEFLRYGSIHRNAYLNSPELLNENLSLKALPNVWLAGQFSGVEGYTESIAMGLLVSIIIDKEIGTDKSVCGTKEEFETGWEAGGAGNVLPFCKTVKRLWKSGTFETGQEAGCTKEESQTGQEAGCTKEEFETGQEAGYTLPESTIMGQFWRRLITPCEQRFQPVNANFGLMPELVGVPKNEKKAGYVSRAIRDLRVWNGETVEQ